MRKTIQPLLLTVTLTIGIAVCWGMIVGWLIWSVLPTQSSDSYKTVAFASSINAPVIVHHALADASLRRLYDLEGREHPEISPNSLDSFKTLHTVNGPVLSSHGVLPVAACALDRECWYLVVGHKDHAYFECYDRLSRHRIGTMGLNGFNDNPPGLENQFPLATGRIDSQSVAGDRLYYYRPYIPSEMYGPNNPVYINSGKAVYRVDVCRREVKQVYSSPEQVQSIGTFALDKSDSGETLRVLLIVASRRLEIFWDRRKSPATINLPQGSDNRSLNYYVGSDGTAFLYHVEGIGPYMAHISAFDSDGRLLWQRETEIYSRPVSRRSDLVGLAIVPIPLAITVILIVRFIIVPYYFGAPVSERELAQFAEWELWICFAAVFAASAIVAVLAYRRQRQYFQPPSAASAWAALVFLGGPPAYLAFLAHRYWPPRETLLPPKVEPEAIELTGREILA